MKNGGPHHPELVPRAVRVAVVDAVSGWGIYKVREIADLFLNEGFGRKADYLGTGGGQRRQEAEAFQATIDHLRPRHAQRPRCALASSRDVLMDDGTRASYASSSRIGRAVELLVATSCMLASRGRLTVSTPLVDDEGIDLIFSARDVPVTLSVQVKSRVLGTSSISNGIFRTQVRDVALRPRPDVYLLSVVADADAGRSRRHGT